jgi:hypothetical protein
MAILRLTLWGTGDADLDSREDRAGDQGLEGGRLIAALKQVRNHCDQDRPPDYFHPKICAAGVVSNLTQQLDSFIVRFF